MAVALGPVPDQRRDDSSTLPHGVALWPLTMHRDQRGTVFEFFRAEWPTQIAPLQWLVSTSGAGTLRGVHVHLRHDDYFVLLDGRALVGLRDLRPGSPSEGRTALLELRGAAPAALVIPHGVAHGLLFSEASHFVVGATQYYDCADELGCHWRDPDLGIAWPVELALLSERDAALPPLRELAPLVPPWSPR